MSRANKLVLVLVVPILTCLMVLACCSTAVIGSNVRLYFYDRQVERVYREKLGIGKSDEEIEAFMTKELKGLTHPEVLEKLSQWGDVEEEENCSFGGTFGSCIVHISNFLGTRSGYRLTIFYKNSKVDSVAIFYS